MKLYSHQQKIVDQKPHRTLLSWETGTGKSLAAIELMRQVTPNFLVICPKGLKKKWERDVYQSSDEEFVKVVTKEEFKRDSEKLSGFTGVIVDEAHVVAGMKSQLSKSLLAWLKINKIEYRVLLTATPYLSSPLNIYRLAQVLGHKWNYQAFVNKFFNYIPMGARRIPVVKKGIEKDIAELVKQIGDVVKLDECIDVPEQIHETVYFALNKTQEQLKIKITQTEINHIVKFTKIHQIEQGTLKGGDMYEDIHFCTTKDDYIVDIAKENKKIAVFCRYNLQIEHLKGLLESKKKQVFVLNGDTPDRDAVVRQIETSDECIALINSACSEGYELPSIGVIIYASLSFSYKDLRQSHGRFLRINRMKRNVYVYLLVEEGIDVEVHKALMEKHDFSLEIYSKNI